MLDTSLLQELLGALEMATNSAEVPSNAVLFLAKKALNILFGGTGDENIFNLGGLFDSVGQGFVAGLNQDGLSEASGLSDAINNKFGRSFEALTWYYHLWKQLINQNMLDEHAVYLATSLAEFIQNEYSTIPDDKVITLTDTGQYTEPFRRVAGFLAMMKSLAPQVMNQASAVVAGTQPNPNATQPASNLDGGAEIPAPTPQSRASLVVNRVVNHLKSYKSYYLVNFLAYVDRRTNGLTRQETVRWAIRNIPILPAPATSEAGKLQKGDQISIPAEGVHIEAVAGTCPPLDVPDAGSSFSANINVTASE